MPIPVCSEASGFLFVHARDAQKWFLSQPALAYILIILPFTLQEETLQGTGTFDSPPSARSLGRSGLASEPLCLPPADVCINKPIVPARTTPFTAAPSRQG